MRADVAVSYEISKLPPVPGVLQYLADCLGWRHLTAGQHGSALDLADVGLGVGAGWDQPEFESLNIPFRSPAERCGQLQTVLKDFRSIWSLSEAGEAEPAAKRHPQAGHRPPLLVGGDGERRTLPAAVAYADAVNWQVGISEFTRKSRVLAQLCEARAGTAVRSAAPTRPTSNSSTTTVSSDGGGRTSSAA